MAKDDNRTKALNAALSQIERQFGKGAVMRMGDAPRVAIPSVSTGSLGWISHSASAACPSGAWSRSMARNPRARRP